MQPQSRAGAARGPAAAAPPARALCRGPAPRRPAKARRGIGVGRAYSLPARFSHPRISVALRNLPMSRIVLPLTVASMLALLSGSQPSALSEETFGSCSLCLDNPRRKTGRTATLEHRSRSHICLGHFRRVMPAQYPATRYEHKPTPSKELLLRNESTAYVVHCPSGYLDTQLDSLWPYFGIPPGSTPRRRSGTAGSATRGAAARRARPATPWLRSRKPRTRALPLRRTRPSGAAPRTRCGPCLRTKTGKKHLRMFQCAWEVDHRWLDKGAPEVWRDSLTKSFNLMGLVCPRHTERRSRGADTLVSEYGPHARAATRPNTSSTLVSGVSLSTPRNQFSRFLLVGLLWRDSRFIDEEKSNGGALSVEADSMSKEALSRLTIWSFQSSVSRTSSRRARFSMRRKLAVDAYYSGF